MSEKATPKGFTYDKSAKHFNTTEESHPERAGRDRIPEGYVAGNTLVEAILAYGQDRQPVFDLNRSR